MGRFILRRTTAMVVVLLATSIIVFLIFWVFPGGGNEAAARRIAGRSATPQTIAAVRRDFGFDRPIYVQYARLMERTLDGTLVSYTNGTNVRDEIVRGIPATASLVIGIVFVPYLGRPVRGQVLALRERGFVEAALAAGFGPVRILVREILPNLASTILVFGTLIVANNILTEAALSFLGAGVQPPNPSWGTLISEGQERIRTAPWLTIVPGAAIVLTVVALNIFGDGLRDALDPRAKVRIEH